MKIALASDHRGERAVETIAAHLDGLGHEPVVLADCHGEPCDYPDQALPVAEAVRSGEARFGILVCGSGIGISIAANKVPGIRAALAHDPQAAEMSRRHNDANVLCLAGDRHAPNELEAIVDAFLDARFEGGRHERRVEKIEAIERMSFESSARESG